MAPHCPSWPVRILVAILLLLAVCEPLSLVGSRISNWYLPTQEDVLGIRHLDQRDYKTVCYANSALKLSKPYLLLKSVEDPVRLMAIDDHQAPAALPAAEHLLGGLYTGPYFDQFTSNNISVQVGSTALLPCRVRQAGNRSVSWVRKEDGHLLSVGDDTFISDSRFQAQKIQASDTWTLQIRAVQPNDSGEYECQVSSNEPKISRIVYLRIVEPQVSIKGAPDMYVKSGSPVTLHCHISSFLQSPSYVDWFLNGSRLIHLKNNHPTYSSPQRVGETGGTMTGNWIVATASDSSSSSSGSSNGDASVVRSAVLERIGNDSLLLTLSLSSVSPEDSGQYACSPANTPPARISFHVVNGEHPAAMQHGDNGSWTVIGGGPSSKTLLAAASVLVLFQQLRCCFHGLSRPSYYYRL